MGDLVTSFKRFLFLVASVLDSLIVDGVRVDPSGSKAHAAGVSTYAWVVKRSRADGPFSYWLAIVFYSVSLAFLPYLACPPHH